MGSVSGNYGNGDLELYASLANGKRFKFLKFNEWNASNNRSGSKEDGPGVGPVDHGQGNADPEWSFTTTKDEWNRFAAALNEVQGYYMLEKFDLKMVYVGRGTRPTGEDEVLDAFIESDPVDWKSGETAMVALKGKCRKVKPNGLDPWPDIIDN